MTILKRFLVIIYCTKDSSFKSGIDTCNVTAESLPFFSLTQKNDAFPDPSYGSGPTGYPYWSAALYSCFKSVPYRAGVHVKCIVDL